MNPKQYELFDGSTIVAKQLKAADLEWLAGEGVGLMVACGVDTFYKRLFDVVASTDEEGVQRVLGAACPGKKCVVYHNDESLVVEPLCVYLIKRRGHTLREALVEVLNAMPCMPSETALYRLGVVDYETHGSVSVDMSILPELRPQKVPSPSRPSSISADRRRLYRGGQTCLASFEGTVTADVLTSKLSVGVASSAEEAPYPTMVDSYVRAFQLGFSQCLMLHTDALITYLLQADSGELQTVIDCVELLPGDNRKAFDDSLLQGLQEVLFFGRRGLSSVMDVLKVKTPSSSEQSNAVHQRMRDAILLMKNATFTVLKARLVDVLSQHCSQTGNLQTFSSATWGETLRSDSWPVPAALTDHIDLPVNQGKHLDLLPLYGSVEMKYTIPNKAHPVTLMLPTPAACVLLSFAHTDTMSKDDLRGRTGMPVSVFKPTLSLLLNWRSPSARQPLLLQKEDQIFVNTDYNPTSRKIDLTGK